LKKFPNFIQTEAKDCGPTCIKIISKYYGRTINTQQLRSLSETTRQGSSLLGMSDAADSIGFKTLAAKLTFQNLKDVNMPCILHWNQIHYVVCYRVTSKHVYISDPGYGLIKYTHPEFLKLWTTNKGQSNDDIGIALFLEPTSSFNSLEFDKEQPFGIGFIFTYLLKYKSFLFQLAFGLLAASALQLILPFITQSIVDVGIANLDLGFIYLMMLAQFFIFTGKAFLEVIRSWLLLYLSSRINISLISDFFIKLMKLPIAYFDVRMTGDLMQRINDYKRIEKVLTTSSLSVLFSLINLIVFCFVLAHYSLQIFLIFCIGSILYFGWILIFFKKRREIDYKKFSEVSKEQSTVIELINGMQEIKLHNAEKRMRWNWEYIQANLFKVATNSLKLEQSQTIGSNFINEMKNMVITIFSAKLVIDGEITLGMMIAISFIIGQMNGPIAQLISFLRDLQDAKISVDRLGEIHSMENEEKGDNNNFPFLEESNSIQLNNISFRYTGSYQKVIDNLTLNIPANKTTAIVGVSGSGKTTLMKILLRFYEIDKGEIKVNRININSISHKAWRANCGVVMQEGYIFNDTIAKNIGVGEDYIDKEKLNHALDVANITEYIEQLPLGVETKIGNEGIGVSTGQKQRLLIARAVYKNPSLLFFDEATSALDTNNEKVILKKLDNFFKDRTAIVIAHRLSTVRNADQIVVLDKGNIVEIGNHKSLIDKKGKYYDLIRNQLELGA